jgi:hypothetical protein
VIAVTLSVMLNTDHRLLHDNLLSIGVWYDSASVRACVSRISVVDFRSLFYFRLSRLLLQLLDLAFHVPPAWA